MAAGPSERGGAPAVEVRRSRRRRRTVSAYRNDDGTVVVLMPARMTRAEERRWIATMVARVERSEERRRPSDTDLARRAVRLSDRYLEGLARAASVSWSDHQQQRWGSCTPATRSIRLSSRLRGMPDWVVDYVLLHELTHLLEAGHTKSFWQLVDRYPRAERAKGYLEGAAAAMHLAVPGDDVVDDVVEERSAGGGPAGAETAPTEVDQLTQ